MVSQILLKISLADFSRFHKATANSLILSVCSYKNSNEKYVFRNYMISLMLQYLKAATTGDNQHHNCFISGHIAFYMVNILQNKSLVNTETTKYLVDVVPIDFLTQFYQN